ncbi:MAG: PAS domain S-box protein [Polyangiaceae bacterium]
MNDSREASASFRCLAEALPWGVLHVSTDERVIWCNEQAAEMLGVVREHVLGRRWFELGLGWQSENGEPLEALDASAFRQLVTKMTDGRVVLGVSRADSQTLWCWVTLRPLPDALGQVVCLVDIGDHIDAERTVDSVRARERAVLDGAQVAIIGMDTNGVIHTFNLAASELLGLSRDEVVGKRTLATILDSDEVRRRAAVLGVAPGFDVFVHQARHGFSETREWTYLRQDRGRVPVSLTISPIRDPDRGIIGYMGIAEDISEQRRFMVELQKLALVASRTHNLVIVADAEARAEWVNEAFTRITGYRLDEIKGRKIGPLVQGPDTDPSTIAKMRDAIRQGRGFQVEVLNYAKMGRRYWLEIDCQPLHAADGTLIGFIAVEAEITARKAMEAQLRDSEARLRAFVEALPDMVFRISSDGRFLDVHAPREEQLLLPARQLIGRRIVDVMPPEIAESFQAAASKAMRDNVAQSYEFELELPSGPKEYEARVVPGSGFDVLAIVRDVSERRFLDLMKDEFVSTVSHELRTPLTAIQGTLGLLAAGVLGNLTSEAQELVNAALSNSERLGRLINDILDIEKVTRDGLEMNCAAHALAPLLERAIGESAVFAAEYHVNYVPKVIDRTLIANVDVDRFLQILHNLLSNAAKYGSTYDEVTVGLERAGNEIRIYVRNRGAPIPESFRRRIFSRFAVLDGTNMRSRQGTGLGLAITKELVTRMGGKIDYVSSHEFTEFFVLLPDASHSVAP